MKVKSIHHCCWLFWFLTMPLSLFSQKLQHTDSLGYLGEALIHNSPNEGKDFHVLGWFTYNSDLRLGNHSLKLNLSLTHGTEPSANIVGDLQTFSNIEAGNLFGFYEFYYQYEKKDRFWIKLGQLDINTDFAISDVGAFYTHSSFGIDPVIAIGARGPTYPFAGFSLSTGIQFSDNFSIKTALFDGQFFEPERKFLTLDWTLNRKGGIIFIFEPAISLFNNRLKQKFGFYRHSGEFSNLSNATIKRGLMAYYLIGDVKGFDLGNSKLEFFYQLNYSPQASSVIDFYWGTGLKISNLKLIHPKDQLGVAIGHASLSSDLPLTQQRFAFDNETAIELSYQIQIIDWLQIQPYFHHIRFGETNLNRKQVSILAIRLLPNLEELLNK